MIEPLRWPPAKVGEAASPFYRGHTERPLRLTLHSSSFTGTSDDDAEAIDALRDLSRLSQIQAVDTEAGRLPHLRIGAPQAGGVEIPISVTGRGDQVECRITQADYWKSVAAQLTGRADPQHPDAQVAFRDVLVARAHDRLGYDLLVTLSRALLDSRTQSNMRGVNIRTPLEAVKIVGLFARSRGNYTYRRQAKFDQGLFYWALARHRLPGMWRYFSACIEAENIRKDATIYLGEGILKRAVRALQARDAVGAQFYLPQNNNTTDTILYHFDYLTLLLVGMFDAQARVAHRAYGVSRPRERNASFRRKDYWEALKHAGATNLYRLISGPRFRDLMTLLHELRNTIHGAAWPASGSFIMVLPDYRQALWEAAIGYSSPGHWGLVQQGTEVRCEAYTYATALVEECLKEADAIAGATDIEKLFPSGHTIPPLTDQPPQDEVFGQRTRRRLAILG